MVPMQFIRMELNKGREMDDIGLRPRAVKMTIKFLLLASLCAYSGIALAEGGTCPAGYYPIGGQGAQGCAPIPNYHGDDEQGSFAPQEQWQKTWGAIAIDETVNDGGIGTVTGLPDQQAAVGAALAQCRSSGGSDGCELLLSYQNQCAVIVSGVKYLNAHSAETIELASSSAIQKCSQRTTGCKIYYSACSAPVQIQ